VVFGSYMSSTCFFNHKRLLGLLSCVQNIGRVQEYVIYFNLIFMWLVEQRAILTKDIMIRRWQGAPGCYFCGGKEIVDHVLFECPVAKVVWGIVAICFQQNDRPSSYDQFWLWIRKALPGSDKVFMLGLAGICWTIWKAVIKLVLTKTRLRILVKCFTRLCVYAILVRSVSRGYAKLIIACRCGDNDENCNQDSGEATREGVDKMLTDGSEQAAEPEEEDQNEGAQNAGESVE
jgi:hypothetical protein